MKFSDLNKLNFSITHSEIIVEFIWPFSNNMNIDYYNKYQEKIWETFYNYCSWIETTLEYDKMKLIRFKNDLGIFGIDFPIKGYIYAIENDIITNFIIKKLNKKYKENLNPINIDLLFNIIYSIKFFECLKNKKILYFQKVDLKYFPKNIIKSIDSFYNEL
jgi:hypothetical protein